MGFTAHIPNLTIPDVLRVLSARRLSGFLSVVSGGVAAKIVFKGGNIAYASSDTTGRLGSVLVEKRIITEEGLERALRLQRGGEINVPLASCLLELGLVFPEVLERETREHIVCVCADLHQWESGQVYFEEHTIEDRMVVLREGVEVERVLEEVERLRRFELTASSTSRTNGFPLEPPFGEASPRL